LAQAKQLPTETGTPIVKIMDFESAFAMDAAASKISDAKAKGLIAFIRDELIK
jgi:hypothetical protein